MYCVCEKKKEKNLRNSILKRKIAFTKIHPAVGQCQPLWLLATNEKKKTRNTRKIEIDYRLRANMQNVKTIFFSSSFFFLLFWFYLRFICEMLTQNTSIASFFFRISRWCQCIRLQTYLKFHVNLYVRRKANEEPFALTQIPFDWNKHFLCACVYCQMQ